MKIEEFIRIYMVPMNADPSIETEHVLLMEYIGDAPIKYYLAKLPIININVKSQLKYYENLVN